MVPYTGTVCDRKGQLYSTKAIARVIGTFGCVNAKLLMVGARYTRAHEVNYIERIKDEVSLYGMNYARWEDVQYDMDQRGKGLYNSNTR